MLMEESASQVDRRGEIEDHQAPLGANQQQMIKDAMRWEVEIIERKNEERFREIE